MGPYFVLLRVISRPEGGGEYLYRRTYTAPNVLLRRLKPPFTNWNPLVGSGKQFPETHIDSVPGISRDNLPVDLLL